MKITLINTSNLFFYFSVAFYFSYACFAVKKLLVRVKG